MEAYEVPPRFEIEDVEDAYAFYVLMLGISEELFWDADISFLRGVVEDKTAYDGWSASVQRRKAERARKRGHQRKR